MSNLHVCACGCGKAIEPTCKYKRGHRSKEAEAQRIEATRKANKLRVWTAAARMKIGKANRGRRHERSAQYRANLSEALTAYYSKHVHHKSGKSHSREHRTRIANALIGHRHSLETRAKIANTRKMHNIKPWNWLIGRSGKGPYPAEWQAARKHTLIRDKYKCVWNCGYANLRYKNPDVHHIDGNKRNCCPANLVCLCRRCHRQAHYDLVRGGDDDVTLGAFAFWREHALKTNPKGGIGEYC